MANRKDEVTFDEFVRIWATWSSNVPAQLARQDPSTVAQLLNLGLREGGISQTDLQRELRMNQPRLSKLVKKLLRAGWVRVRRSETDNRVRLMTTTVPARKRIARMTADLESLLRAGRVELAQTPVRKQTVSPPRRRIEKQPLPQFFKFEE